MLYIQTSRCPLFSSTNYFDRCTVEDTVHRIAILLAVAYRYYWVVLPVMGSTTAATGSPSAPAVRVLYNQYVYVL